MSSFHTDERRTDFGDALWPSGAGADCSRFSFERAADLQCLEEVPDFRGPGQNERHMDEIGADGGAQIGAAALAHLDDAQGLPALEGFAHRRTADGEAFREETFDRQPATWFNPG